MAGLVPSLVDPEHPTPPRGRPWIWLRLKGLEPTWTLGFYELQWVCWTLLGAVLFAWCLWKGRERSWR